MIEGPLAAAMRRIAEVPLNELRNHVAQMPSSESTCRTCDERIRSTPAIHADGSIHWASGGWEHTTTEQSSCGKLHPYGFAVPADDYAFELDHAD